MSPQTQSIPEALFQAAWNSLGGPPLTLEHAFFPGRKWRFDFAHLPTKTAIEIEGGVWSAGRHVKPAGFTKDCIKYNSAALGGWTVFRLPTSLVQDLWVEKIIGHCEVVAGTKNRAV